MRPVHRSPIARGFTLIELLVTLVIVSVGMLGLAKLQAAGVAESSVSRVRSLMTFQAESLAGMMQSNRGYWAVTTGTAPWFQVAKGSGTVTDKAGTLSTAKNCQTDFCTAPAALAGFDVTNWASAFNLQFPTGTAEVKCTIAAGLPTTCDITLSWDEHYVAINKSATTGTKSSTDTISMVLHVQP